MALVIQPLIDGFTDMTVNFAVSPEEAAYKMAHMYQLYAVNAQTPVGGSANAGSVAAAAAVLQSTLTPIFRDSKEASRTASGMNSAFTTFWSSIIFSPAIIPPAIITGGPALEGMLGAMGPTMDAQTSINNLATAFDAFTKAVQVTCPGTPPVTGFLF